MLCDTADTAQVTLGRTRSLNENIEKKGVQLSGGGKYAPLLGRSTECAPGGREPNRRRNKRGEGTRPFYKGMEMAQSDAHTKRKVGERESILFQAFSVVMYIFPNYVARC